MQALCRQASSTGASTSGREWPGNIALTIPGSVNTRSVRPRHNFVPKDLRSYFEAACLSQSASHQTACGKHHRNKKQPKRQFACQCSHAIGNNSSSSNNIKGPVIVIDNYDSFTYNLCQYLGDLGCEHIVFKNDEKTIDELRALNPRGILLSPGPGRPEDSGIALQTVKELGPEFPIFGVCMGHQCIGQVFGGDVVRAPSGVMHGKTSPVHHKDTGLLKGLSNPFLAARYHSLVIAKDSVPDVLEVTAWTEDGTVMAVQHKQYPQIQGVQFHPESIITDNGRQVVKNFIDSLG